eukprot:CAMPEP_0181171194 /NCGR_PEP_ID=MMETSP1096-20121128/1773_1 /TAXON_ID=156174 ORGANISM="Chrysochromulina ericina, Strain CCMP281" /NCGR_SAMPLE_ID=MMETSP1096 /ASSEMBLY_ACC=CAM_ASM_000453 /LENGTH=265 /DNA_ID=CAMNT_0023258813 /DNA_START=916 /DNA_END=1710 /DNA_ORIENTATION=-
MAQPPFGHTSFGHTSLHETVEWKDDTLEAFLIAWLGGGGGTPAAADAPPAGETAHLVQLAWHGSGRGGEDIRLIAAKEGAERLLSGVVGRRDLHALKRRDRLLCPEALVHDDQVDHNGAEQVEHPHAHEDNPRRVVHEPPLEFRHLALDLVGGWRRKQRRAGSDEAVERQPVAFVTLHVPLGKGNGEQGEARKEHDGVSDREESRETGEDTAEHTPCAGWLGLEHTLDEACMRESRSEEKIPMDGKVPSELKKASAVGSMRRTTQ